MFHFHLEVWKKTESGSSIANYINYLFFVSYLLETWTKYKSRQFWHQTVKKIKHFWVNKLGSKLMWFYSTVVLTNFGFPRKQTYETVKTDVWWKQRGILYIYALQILMFHFSCLLVFMQMFPNILQSNWSRSWNWKYTQFYKWGKHTLSRLLGLLRGNNRYLLYFYKDISLGAVHLKYITVYLLIKVSNLRAHRVEHIFLTSRNFRKNYSFENHVKYFEIAISGKSAPFGFIQYWIFG